MFKLSWYGRSVVHGKASISVNVQLHVKNDGGDMDSRSQAPFFKFVQLFAFPTEIRSMHCRIPYDFFEIIHFLITIHYLNRP